MRTAFLTVIAAVSVSASTAAAAGMSFEDKKAEQVKRVEERITHLQEERACIQAARSHEALKSCHQVFRDEVRADKLSRKKQ